MLTVLFERETGFGPANSSLEGYCLTTWRLPHAKAAVFYHTAGGVANRLNLDRFLILPETNTSEQLLGKIAHYDVFFWSYHVLLHLSPGPAPMIRALIFDFDGTILETEGPIYESWQAIYQSFGQHLPIEIWSDTIGTWDSEFNPAADLERRVGRRLDWDLLEARRAAHEKDLLNGLGLQPGVADYLLSARRLGLRIGLASSSGRAWVSSNLERLGIKHFFECIRTREDVARTKPDPELFLAASACLGVSPQEAIALEDSQHGIDAAHRAGLFAVAIPTYLTRHLPFENADLRLNSLAELPLDELLQAASLV